MTHRFFMLDVPENTSIATDAGAAPDVTLNRIGPYLVVECEGPIVIDRRSAGARHAVWYSCIAGLDGTRITRWDKDTLRIEPR